MASNVNGKRMTRSRPKGKARGAETSTALNILSRSFDTQQVRNIPPCPPTRVSDPWVRRTVRIENLWSQGGTGTYTQTVTYANIANQDSQDYGTSSPRYAFLRVEKFVVWINNDMQSLGAAPTGSSLVCQLNDGSVGSAAVMKDTLSRGVDWARMGFVPDLQQRLQYLSTTSGTIAATVSINVAAGGADINGGTIVIDVTASFR